MESHCALIPEPLVFSTACCVTPHAFRTGTKHMIKWDVSYMIQNKTQNISMPPYPKKRVSETFAPLSLGCLPIWILSLMRVAWTIVGLQFLLMSLPRTSCCRNPIACLKSFRPRGDWRVSSPEKHIVRTVKVYSLKSSSCIFIRMKYRALCSVQGFINDVLSGAGCSAYLHIKQLSEETFLLLLQGINQFKASSHHLYSFQLSLLLLK